MARYGRFFVHEVNVAIVGLAALAAVVCGVHYVSLLNQVQRARQELCAARLEAVASRHPYLRAAGNQRDKCAALAVLTGDLPAEPRTWRPRFSL